MVVRVKEPTAHRRTLVSNVKGLSRKEATAIALSESGHNAKRETVKFTFYLGALAMMLVLLPNETDTSFKIGGIEFTKVSGHKEILVLFASFLLHKIASAIWEVHYYFKAYRVVMEMDFGDSNRSEFVRVMSERPPPAYYIEGDKESLTILRLNLLQNLVAFAIVAVCIGSVLLVTIYSLIGLILEPTLPKPVTYMLMSISSLTLVLFAVSILKTMVHFMAKAVGKEKAEDD